MPEALVKSRDLVLVVRRWGLDAGGAGATLAVVVALGAAAAWAAGELGGVSVALGWLPVGSLALAAALAARTGGCLDVPARRKWGWRWVTVFLVLLTLGRALEELSPRLPDGGADAVGAGIDLTSYLPLFAALGCMMRGQRPDGGQLAQFRIDALAGAIGFGAFAWFFFVEPLVARLGQGGSGPREDLARAILATSGFLLAVLALLRHRSRRGRPVLAWLVAGISTLMAARIIETHPLYRADTLADALAMAAAAAIAIGAHLEFIDSAPLDSRQAREIHPTPAGQLLPFAGLAIAAATLLYFQSGAWDQPAGQMALVVCATFALALLRQSLAVREFAALQSRSAVAAVERRFAALVLNSSDVLAITDGEGRFLYATPSAERIFGRPAQSLEGVRLPELVAHEERVRVQEFFGVSLAPAGATETVELRIPRGADRFRIIEVVGANRIDEPSVAGLVLNIRDITDRKSMEEQLRRLAFHDPLTLLANRALFRNRVEHALAVSRRRSTPVAAIFIDLDNFKKINDTLGHGVGDKVLRTTAQRLAKCTRTGDTVARLGGDEFALLIEDAVDREQVLAVAARLVDVVREPFSFAGSNLGLGASVGVAFAEPTDGVEELLRNADVAMYQAKAAGKSRYAVFESVMQKEVQDRFQLENDLNQAFSRREFRVFYQPIVDLHSGYLLGVEALVRWQHPDRGLMLPAAFIDVAEETGQVVGLGRWVLFEACSEMSRWQRRMPVGHQLRLAVNISAQQVQRGDVVSDVTAALEKSGLDPGCLVIEMTEGVVMQDTESTFATLTRLKKLGVRIAIDDFGTGYSSLSYLHRFPIDILKIDRSFVQRLGAEAGGSGLAQAVITLGTTLGLEVVAEGVEHEQQMRELIQLGCVAGQGFYYSRPGPLEEIEFSLHMSLRRRYADALPEDTRFTATGRFELSSIQPKPVDLDATGTFDP